jgi:hypothetical protein
VGSSLKIKSHISPLNLLGSMMLALDFEFEFRFEILGCRSAMKFQSIYGAISAV